MPPNQIRLSVTWGDWLFGHLEYFLSHSERLGMRLLCLSEIEKCGADLAKRTQVLGVVLNKCRYMEDEESRAYSE